MERHLSLNFKEFCVVLYSILCLVEIALAVLFGKKQRLEELFAA